MSSSSSNGDLPVYFSQNIWNKMYFLLEKKSLGKPLIFSGNSFPTRIAPFFFPCKSCLRAMS